MRSFHRSLIHLSLIAGLSSLAWAQEPHNPCDNLLRSQGKSESPSAPLTAIRTGMSELTKLDKQILTKNQSRNLKSIEKKLEKLSKQLENAPSSEKKSHLLALISKWDSSLSRLPDMLKAYENIDEEQKPYFLNILRAAISTVTSHMVQLLQESSLQKTDFAQFHHILDEMSRFNLEKPRVSFYRIKKKIEARFSLREYINCRI